MVGDEQVTDEQIQQWADEAEAGYDVQDLKRRGRGRPGRGGLDPCRSSLSDSQPKRSQRWTPTPNGNTCPAPKQSDGPWPATPREGPSQRAQARRAPRGRGPGCRPIQGMQLPLLARSVRPRRPSVGEPLKRYVEILLCLLSDRHPFEQSLLGLAGDGRSEVKAFRHRSIARGVTQRLRCSPAGTGQSMPTVHKSTDQAG